MLLINVVIFLMFVCLAVMLEAIKLSRTKLSVFELKRRCDKGDLKAIKIRDREEFIDDVVLVQKILTPALIVLFVVVGIALFGWLTGAVLSFVGAISILPVSRLKNVSEFSSNLVSKYESNIIIFISKVKKIIKLIKQEEKRVDYYPNSREEVVEIITKSKDLLSDSESKMILNSLKFGDLVVKDILVPFSVVHTIESDEVLGPLVLDDLHKTGHSRFPVTSSETKDIVGMLYIRELLSLEEKKTMTVKKAMDKRVLYIREDQTLWQALSTFIKTKHHLFVVTNKLGEIVGIVSLEDIMEALLGQEIIDEFDDHDDLKKVAVRTITKIITKDKDRDA